jgi:glycosyltransferase involved in cell wall biosynthesis
MLGAWIEWLCARLGKAHLCISPTTGRRLQDLLRVPGDTIRVIPSGFSSPDWASHPTAKTPYKVVAAGRLMDYKRVDLVLRAWPAVLKELPEAALHVFGEGPERPALERLASELGVESSVLFRGQVPDREDVLHEIASASLLVQPSVREGQSLVVAEAMALGTPVLAAEGPETAVSDFVGADEESEWTLLPAEAGPDAWSERIVRLLVDLDLGRRLTRYGKVKSRQLNWRESIAPQIESCYLELGKAVPC